MEFNIGYLTLALLAGIAAGLFFFGGLWLTVRRIPTSRNPHLMLIGSFFLRLAGVLVVFYFLAPMGWQAMAAGLCGLLITRQIMVRRKSCRPSVANQA